MKGRFRNNIYFSHSFQSIYSKPERPWNSSKPYAIILILVVVLYNTGSALQLEEKSELLLFLLLWPHKVTMKWMIEKVVKSANFSNVLWSYLYRWCSDCVFIYVEVVGVVLPLLWTILSLFFILCIHSFIHWGEVPRRRTSSLCPIEQLRYCFLYCFLKYWKSKCVNVVNDIVRI